MENGQKNRKKNPWRFLFLALAAYGAWKLFGGIWVNILCLFLNAQRTISVSEAYSVGIIGGADGPTAVFVSAPVWGAYIVPVMCLIVGIFGFFKLRKK